MGHRRNSNRILNMATFVQKTQTPADANTSTTVAGSAMNQVTGHFNVVFVAWLDASNSINVTSVTDTAGNTYTPGVKNNSNNTSSQMFYAKNLIAHASNVVTATFSSTTQYRSIIVADYSGVTIGTPLDVEATVANGTNATITSSSFSTSNPDDLIVVCSTGSPAFSAGTGYTLRSSGNYAALEDKNVSSVQSSVTATMTQTGSNSFNCHVMAFKDAYKKVLVSSGGVDIMILEPSGFNSAAGAPLVYYHHGAGEDREALVTDSLKYTIVLQMASEGRLMAGISAGESWGNQTSLDNYVTAYNYLAANYSLKGTVIFSQSMGGCAGGLAFAGRNYPDIRGWIGIYPVCNLANMYAGSFQGAINTAYGITGVSPNTYAEKTAGHDPVLLASTLYNNRMMRFYASAADTVVTKTDNSDQMKTLVQSETVESTIVVCSGDHGDPSHFQPSDFSAFIIRCLSHPFRKANAFI